jgi:ABC-type nitrate/sulfonate/bicarbonate transport system substrate-binding protein
VCSGSDAGASVPGDIMVRKDFGDEDRETVSEVLAAWFRAIEFMKDGDDNVSIFKKEIEKDIDLRPIFGLDEQFTLFDREDSTPSTVDNW